MEEEKNLKKGDIFLTKKGTYIVYVGNNHKWHHLSKKLYDMLLSLKNKNVILEKKKVKISQWTICMMLQIMYFLIWF